MASRSRKSPSRGGGGNNATLNKAIWFIAVAALIVAFFQIPYDPGVKGVTNVIEAKAKTVETWAKGVGPGIGDWFSKLIEGGRSQTAPQAGDVSYTPYKPLKGVSVETSTTNLNKTKTSAPQKVAYDRDQWKHWNEERGCWNVREQVLVRDAVPGTIKLLDKNKKPTTNANNACEVASGKWVDPYTGKTFTNPKDLDIDHMIPLKYAATHGGQNWDSKKKQNYANSLDNGHLLAVSASANRSKSDKGPSDWAPSNKEYQCTYASSWTTITTKWGLSITEKDKTVLQNMLKTCK